MADLSFCKVVSASAHKERSEDLESELSTEFGDSDCEPHDHDTTTHKWTLVELPSKSFSYAETLILLDWDDTLFPTTWIEQEGLMATLQTTGQSLKLEQLAERVEATLSAAKQRGKVVIVTNALKGWVERSSSRFMPSLPHHLQDVDVISARSSFEADAQVLEWKCLAFAQQVRAFYGASNRRRNIISLGDALYEQRALVAVTQCVPNCYAKSLKFMEKPLVEQLIEEHDMLIGSLHEVIDHEDNLDLEVTPEY